MRRHPNAGVGRPWLLKTVIRWIEALLRAVCAMQRDCVHGCPTAEGCVLAALCARERVAGCTYVCGRLAAECAGLSWLQRQVCAERRKDGSYSCCRADQETALVLAACEKEAGQRDTNGFTALMGAVQHRNIDLARLLLRRSRIQRGTAAAHRGVLAVLPWQDAVSL